MFELERRGYIKAGPYVPEVILDEPDALRQLHREFLRAGADVMVALTYYAHREKLKDVGRGDDLEELNRQAVRIANEIARRGRGARRRQHLQHLVLRPRGPDRVGRRGARAVRGAARLGGRGGRGLRHRRDVRPRRRGADRPRRLQAARAPGPGHLRERAARAHVRRLRVRRRLPDPGRDGAAVVGLNCSRGPETMLPLLEQIRAAVDVPVAAQPVPYRTCPGHARVRVAGVRRGPARCSRSSSSPSSARGSRWPTSRAGRGTSASATSASAAAGRPHHVRAMAEALGRETPASRYSPAIELHPVLGEARGEDGEAIMGGWTAA